MGQQKKTEAVQRTAAAYAILVSAAQQQPKIGRGAALPRYSVFLKQSKANACYSVFLKQIKFWRQQDIMSHPREKDGSLLSVACSCSKQQGSVFLAGIALFLGD